MIANLRAGALIAVLSIGARPAQAADPASGAETRPADSSARTAAPAKPAKPRVTTAAKPIPAPVASKPAATAPASKSAGTATTTPTSVRPAVTSPAVTPVRPAKPAVRPTPTPEAASVEERVTYSYNALGRRDPFQPLVGGGYVGAEEQLAPPDVGGIKVVGIVWGAQDKFALVEDPRGNSMVLRQGDKVMNGTVDGLRRDKLIIKLATEGSTEYVEIPLTRKGESNGNR